MLTIVTIPKPFVGHVGDIQRNAIESWQALGPDVQVVLVGDEAGIAEAARDAGVDHVGGVARNERGTPRLDSAFALAAEVARAPLWCLVNGDIVLLDDFRAAIERVGSAFDDFVMIGECRDLAVDADLRPGDTAVRAKLRTRALAEGRLRGWAALDYFVFPRGLFDPLPPFLIGRACFDNWLVWRARERHHPVVDATRAVVAVHQSHDYSHVAGGLEEAYYGDEAKYNERLAGGREHIYSLHDATHRLYRAGPPVPYVLSYARARERARVLKASYDYRQQYRRDLKAQQAVPLRVEAPVRLLGVFPEPRGETTRLLDAVASDDNVDLTVLYVEADDEQADPKGHTHYVPRSVRVPALSDRPINWAIMRSFRGLTPDCMIISGWDTFATQSAVAWCTARDVPYVLLVDAPNGDGSGWRHALATRNAAAIVVSNDPAPTAFAGNGLDPNRVRRLPDAPEEAATLVLDVARAERNARIRAS